LITQSTIDTIFETARVEEIIGDFVQLKRAGSNLKGLSPFSDERTPSFMVSPVKQIWKDFSTGKGGNAVSFLMEHEHFTYPEALKYIARKYTIAVEETEQTEEQKEQANERESLYVVSEFASQFFQNTLWKTEQGKAIGLSYFKERGFTEETIKKFGLGYSPDTWDAFTSEGLRKGYKLEFLEKTGLTIVKEEKLFDRFKGRVMFPIQSMSGRVLGFGGRILGTGKRAAKYLNSPESDIYHKSKVLYGIYGAKQAIAKEDNCYLVEGYTDVIQFQQTGIANVVSSSGTALTSDQIRLVSRLTKNITVLFDGDAAGMRASIRGVDLILEQGMNVRVCTFPEGEDPDSFARENSLEQLQTYLKENAMDFIRFKASMLRDESKDDPIKKATLIRDMVTSISKIPDVIKREIYVQECSRIMDISEEVVFSTLAQILNTATKQEKKQQKQEQQQQSLAVVKSEPSQVAKVDEQYELERKLIEILLLYGKEVAAFEDLVLKENDEGDLELEPDNYEAKVFEKIYLDLQDDEVEFTNLGFRQIYKILVEKMSQDQPFQVESFINEVPPEIAEEVTSILMNEERYVLHDWERNEIYVKLKEKTIGQLVNDTILNLRRYLVNNKIDELSKAIQNSNQENSEKNAVEAQEILQGIMDYNGLKKILAEKLNRVI